MQFPEPVLSTELVGKATRVTARYETPETARMVLSLRMMTAGVSSVGLATAALRVLSHVAPSNQAWLIGATLSIIAACAIGQTLADALHRCRFLARRLTDATLVVTLDRRRVTHAGVEYLRGGVLRFTALPHRHGRHEERDERIKERLISTIYREAHQVWLQHGEEFTLLADVSDERGAAAIVRRLQEMDETISRRNMASTECGLGQRQEPI